MLGTPSCPAPRCTWSSARRRPTGVGPPGTGRAQRPAPRGPPRPRGGRCRSRARHAGRGPSCPPPLASSRLAKRIAALGVLDDRDAVDHRQARDRLRGVQGQPHRDVAAPVVLDRRTARARAAAPLRGRRRPVSASGRAGGRRRSAAWRTARSRAGRGRRRTLLPPTTRSARGGPLQEGQPGRDQQRHHPVPGGVRARVPVQQTTGGPDPATSTRSRIPPPTSTDGTAPGVSPRATAPSAPAGSRSAD